MGDSVVQSSFSRRRRAWAIAAICAVVALFATWEATAGLRWSVLFHPDEPLVAAWIDQTRDEGRVTDRVYPGGWFQLFRFRLFLERKIEDFSEAWESHSVQDGVVSAVHERTYAWKMPPPSSPPPNHSVQDGRDFNAFLYALSAVLILLGALEAGLRPVAALISALFFLASPGPAEFCRYCETDAGLVFSLAFFAWCAARAVRRRSPAWMLFASFAAGFASACKYSLAPLVFWVPVLAAVVPLGVSDAKQSGERKTRARRLAALTLAGFALAAAGFLYGTPALLMDPEWWLSSYREVSTATYSEMLSNLGGKPSWTGAAVIRASNLVRHLAAFGLPTLLWGAFSWSFWLRRPFRRQLAGVPLLLPAFFPFAVFLFPFVRSQETLPVAMVIAFGAGLPLEWWLRRRANGPAASRRLRVAACAAAVFGTLALCDSALRASGMISCFRLRDTRAEAQNWLLASLPEGAPVAFDGYVGQIARGIPCRVSKQPGGLQWRWNGAPEPCGPGLPPPRYYLENVGFTWRFPVQDLRTGRLKKEVRDRIEAWNADTFLIREWFVSPDVPHPTFGQPPVRIVSFDVPAPGAADAPVALPRPLAFLPPDAPLYDASGPAGLGALRAFRLVGKRTTVRLARDRRPRWLVVRSVSDGTPMKVEVERFFRPGKTGLDPGGATAFALRPSVLDRLLFRAVAWPAARARLRGDDQNNVVAAFLTPSAAEAARALRIAGRCAEALTLLREAGMPDDAARVEAFLAARSAGVTVEPEWEEAARGAIAACESVAKVAGRVESSADDREARAAASVGGGPVGPVVDFARLRLVRQAVVPGVPLPVFLPKGRYTIVLSPTRSEAGLPPAVPEHLFVGQLGGFRKELAPNGAHRLVADVDVRDPGAFLVPSGDPSAFTPFFAEVEIAWSVSARLREAASDIQNALGRAKTP